MTVFLGDINVYCTIPKESKKINQLSDDTTIFLAAANFIDPLCAFPFFLRVIDETSALVSHNNRFKKKFGKFFFFFYFNPHEKHVVVDIP